MELPGLHFHNPVTPALRHTYWKTCLPKGLTAATRGYRTLTLNIGLTAFFLYTYYTRMQFYSGRNLYLKLLLLLPHYILMKFSHLLALSR